MAVKKPIRRKRTRGRNFAGINFAGINFASMMKAIRSNRWTGTSGLSVAVAFVALVGILTFAFSASTPPAEQSSARTAERPVAPRAATPVAAAPKESPATPVTRGTVETDPEPDGLITGPMPTVVTLTGCLARSDNEFRLKDTTGLNAPKSRSWKSGFLAKRSASISIVPASGELPLSKHVGERVTVSGTLIDREMKVRTLRRVSSSCDEPTPGRITA